MKGFEEAKKEKKKKMTYKTSDRPKKTFFQTKQVNLSSRPRSLGGHR